MINNAVKLTIDFDQITQSNGSVQNISLGFN